MKIKQKLIEVAPIKIELTGEEAGLLWEVVDTAYNNYPIGSKERNLLIEMSNRFTELQW